MSDPNVDNVGPPDLGHYVRLRDIQPRELPAHPDFAPQQILGTAPALPTAPDLATFVNEILEEAHTFMTAYMPFYSKVKSSSKSSPPSTAAVELSYVEVKGREVNKVKPDVASGRTAENWFARTSIHENVAKQGTASWEEFDAGLRENHSQNEMAYTPDVSDAHEVVSWNAHLEQAQPKQDRTEQSRPKQSRPEQAYPEQAHPEQAYPEQAYPGQAYSEQVRLEQAHPEQALQEPPSGEWQDVTACVMEMVHKLPLVDDRVFSVLVVTARKADPEPEFIVVQIPVDTSKMPTAKYNQRGARLTAGMYVSVERGELIDGGTKVRWEMATASNAKGLLPKRLQVLGVPGAIIADVGLFMEWAAKKRAGKA